MKKGLAATILVLTFALTCVAQEVCKRHTQPEGGFSYCPPDGWRIEEQTGEKHKMLFGTPSNGFAPNINIKEGESAAPLADYVAAAITYILANTEKIGATSIKVVGQSDFVTASEQRGMRVVFQSVFKSFLIRTIQYYSNGKDGKKIVVTCTALESDKEVLDAVFDRSMKTFQMDSVNPPSSMKPSELR